MGVREHAVVIAGAGPAGMMLAAELALAGVDVAVVERRPDHVLAGSRAGGFQSRTVEIFDQRGIADRFLAEGRLHRVVMFGASMLDTSDLATRHPYTVAIWQNQIERIMCDWIVELGVPIEYRCEVTGSNLIAEVEMREGPDEDVLHHDATGVHAVHKMEDGTTFRVVVTERQVRPGNEPTLRELRHALTAVFGTDYGVQRPAWISRFTDMTRQAATYRDRRVLLAGDAAHVHYPAGGQGLSLGVQDAVNLGWKLAQVVKGISPQSLLDTYHAERHPVGARILRYTMAQAALQRRDDRTQALVDVISELAIMAQPRHHLAALMTGLDIHYDLGEGHPLLGRRMPDLELTATEGALRVYELLHDAKPVLLNLGAPGSVDVARWEDRVRLIDASHDRAWELPVIGIVSAPTAVLVRPDGYVAWVGGGAQQGLREALTTWFGPPAAAAPRGRRRRTCAYRQND